MYARIVTVDLTHNLSEYKQIIIKFRCELDPYNSSGEAFPIALFEKEEIIFAEDEDNEHLMFFLSKLIGPVALEELSKRAVYLASEKQQNLT